MRCGGRAGGLRLAIRPRLYQLATLLKALGAESDPDTIAKRLRRWDAAEAPPTDEVLALLSLLGRVRGAFGDVCSPIQTRRGRLGVAG
ncbi:MAG: hypothetical protein ACJ8AW_28005 [Rhodopila sp.]